MTEQERQMLLQSVRGFLEEHWPVDGAVERTQDVDAIRAIWSGLAAQGLTTLGSELQEAGLREILLVFDELGRASCPTPLLGAIATNLLFGDQGNVSEPVRSLLDGISDGSAAVSIVLGRFDGDVAAGSADYSNGLLSGQVEFVEDAATATHFVVLTDDPAGVAIVSAGSGIEITANPGLAVPALSAIKFSTRPAAFIELPSEKLADLALILRLACAARARGAAQRAFDLALEHSKLRRQFGQLIGTFQAIQHKLADCLTRLDGSHLLFDSAAATFDQGGAAWRVYASAALAFSCTSLRQVILEAHHTLGAIGYAEEHEAPRHFRRVHADLVRFGGAPRARAELADHLLGSLAKG